MKMLLLLLLCPAVCCGSILAVSDMLPGQVLNYGDFSYVSSIAVGYRYVYFGTTGGVIRYEIDQRAWADPLTGSPGLTQTDIKGIHVSQDDQNVWVSTDMGAFEYDATFDQWDPVDNIPNEPTKAQHLQPDPTYFAPDGYNYLPTGVLIDDAGRRFPITDIVDDGWTNVWVGTWGMGPLHADNTSHRLELLGYGLIQPDVESIYDDNGILWMSGQQGTSLRYGVTVFDWQKNEFDYVLPQSALIYKGLDIHSISGNSRNIFAATDDGVWVIDKKSKTIRQRLGKASGLPDNQILSVLASNDTLFVGTAYGVTILNLATDSTPDSTQEMAKTFLPTSTVVCLERTDSALWIGTTEGAYRLDWASGKIGRLNTPEVSQIGRIYEIKRAGDNMWLATVDNLVSINLKTAEVTAYPEVNGYGGARAVAVTDNIVAVGTTGGLLLIYLGAKERHYIYTVNDGLASNNIHDVVFDGDYIWVGSDEGLTRFWYKNPRLGN